MSRIPLAVQASGALMTRSNVGRGSVLSCRAILCRISPSEQAAIAAAAARGLPAPSSAPPTSSPMRGRRPWLTSRSSSSPDEATEAGVSVVWESEDEPRMRENLDDRIQESGC
jgi:hypothetical protein